jgi:hypothetical protein
MCIGVIDEVILDVLLDLLYEDLEFLGLNGRSQDIQVLAAMPRGNLPLI